MILKAVLLYLYLLLLICLLSPVLAQSSFGTTILPPCGGGGCALAQSLKQILKTTAQTQFSETKWENKIIQTNSEKTNSGSLWNVAVALS